MVTFRVILRAIRACGHQVNAASRSFLSQPLQETAASDLRYVVPEAHHSPTTESRSLCKLYSRRPFNSRSAIEKYLCPEVDAVNARSILIMFKARKLDGELERSTPIFLTIVNGRLRVDQFLAAAEQLACKDVKSFIVRRFEVEERVNMDQCLGSYIPSKLVIEPDNYCHDATEVMVVDSNYWDRRLDLNCQTLEWSKPLEWERKNDDGFAPPMPLSGMSFSDLAAVKTVVQQTWSIPLTTDACVAHTIVPALMSACTAAVQKAAASCLPRPDQQSVMNQEGSAVVADKVHEMRLAVWKSVTIPRGTVVNVLGESVWITGSMDYIVVDEAAVSEGDRRVPASTLSFVKVVGLDDNDDDSPDIHAHVTAQALAIMEIRRKAGQAPRPVYFIIADSFGCRCGRLEPTVGRERPVLRLTRRYFCRYGDGDEPFHVESVLEGIVGVLQKSLDTEWRIAEAEGYQSCAS